MAGSRGELGGNEIIESGEPSNNDKASPSARRENRQRICAIACGGLPLKQSVKFRVFAAHQRRHCGAHVALALLRNRAPENP
jgi:hypothetical protein